MTPQFNSAIELNSAIEAPQTDFESGQLKHLEMKVSILEKRLETLSAENLKLKRQWKDATSTISWKIVNQLSKLASKIAPHGSLRRRLLKSTWRWLMSIRRHGPIAWFRRMAAHVKVRTLQQIQYFSAERKLFVRDDRPVILAISHVGGGGTERHVRDMAIRLAAEGVRPVYARPCSSGQLIFEERDDSWKLLWRRVIRPESRFIEAIIDKIKPSLVHVHHAMGVPQPLFDLINTRQIATDWTLHDYHSICPRIHLHNEIGQYCGEPDQAGCNSCLKRLGNYHSEPCTTTIDKYRDSWAERLATARAIHVPSEDARQRLARYFPELKIQSRPHMEPSRPISPMVMKWNPGESVRVAVIGSIGLIKGSAQLLASARDAAARKLPLQFVLVGTSNFEPQLLSTGRVELTGPYFEHEVWSRLEETACHLAWLPSIWPETYMYTLSVAQLGGFWPIVYNLGAQASRVKTSGYGDCLSIDMPADQLNDLLLKRATELAGRDIPAIPNFAEYPDFLIDYYGLTLEQLKSMGEGTFWQSHQKVLQHPNTNLSEKPHESRSDHARLHEHHCQLSA